jgi:signal transduction histidine kinase
MYDDRVVQWIYHDITQQVELEAMRRDLTAMLYHDLQNPLTNIIASLELLELEMAETLDPISTTMLDVAVRSSQRLRHLIRSLLDINQIEAGLPVTERQAVAVDSIIDYTNSMMSPQFNRRHIDFVATAEPDIPAVFANEDMIQRVLINLTDNAFKYSRPGQTVTLAARQVATHPNHVLITVSDQGPGIPKQHRQAVFDKFFRTPDNPIKGIGLGLSFCRLAIEAHGGQIWVSQAPGGGAQFNLTLPHAQS